jgi:hypothetical protein
MSIATSDFGNRILRHLAADMAGAARRPDRRLSRAGVTGYNPAAVRIRRVAQEWNLRADSGVFPA